jgi:threonine dehydrogenase-like Zn-dependent dehydrogenase
MGQAIGVCRPGGTIGYVGVPYGVSFDSQQLFSNSNACWAVPTRFADFFLT